MRIAEINMMHVGSTGRIMFGIAHAAIEANHEVYTFSPYYYQKSSKMENQSIENHTFFSSLIETKIHIGLAEMTGLHGCWSFFGTGQLIRSLKKIKPDILHLHNLHNFTINLPMLFAYIKKERVSTVWTLHDCWSMTGKCPHFQVTQCDKWKTGCFRCPVVREYPKAYIDQTKLMWRLKRKWFTGITNMMIVTPSQWLANIVKESYLSEYPVRVINNGVDDGIFHPVESNSYEKYGIKANKYKVLGVSFDWDWKKGLDVFIALSKILPENYQIILVGTNEGIDQTLPEKIISIHRTQNQKELAELYSMADVFVNPTREDTFPTVNLEALSCGTPVVTFRTGGSPECIDESCGISVDCDDLDEMKRSIVQVCENKIFPRKNCTKRAELFRKKDSFQKYLELYEEVFKS